MRTEELIREFMASLVPPPGLFNQWQWEYVLAQFEPVVRQKVVAWARGKCPQPWSPQWGYMFALLRITDGSWAPCHVRRRCRQSEPSKYEYAVIVSIRDDSGQLPMFMAIEAPTPEPLPLEYVWLSQWFEDADQAKLAFTLSHSLAILAAHGDGHDSDMADEARAWATSHHISLDGEIVRFWERQNITDDRWWDHDDYAGPAVTEVMAWAFVEALELEYQHSERVIKDSMRCEIMVDVLRNGTIVSHSLTPAQAQALHQITPVLLEGAEAIWSQLMSPDEYTWRELMFLCVPGRFLDFHATSSQRYPITTWPSISLWNVLESVVISYADDVANVVSALFEQIEWEATVRVRFAVTSPYLAHAERLIRYMEMLTHIDKNENSSRPSNWSLEYDLKGNMPSMLMMDPSLNIFLTHLNNSKYHDYHPRNALYDLLRVPGFKAGSCVRLSWGEKRGKKRINAFSLPCANMTVSQNHWMDNTNWPFYLDATTATCLWRRVSSNTNLYNLRPWEIEWPLRWPINPQVATRGWGYVLHDEFDATNSNVERWYASLAQGSVQQ